MDLNEINSYNGAAAYLPYVSAAPIAVYGVQRMVRGYAGPLFQLVRIADSATMDIYANRDNTPNTMGVTAFLNGATQANVGIVYDQSGSGNHATQTTSTKRPFFTLTNAINGAASITFDGNQVASGGQMNIPAAVSAGGKACSALSVHSYESTNASAVLLLGQTWSTAGSLSLLCGYGTTNAPCKLNVLTSASFLGGTQKIRSQPQMMLLTAGAGNIHVYTDEATDTLAANNSAGSWAGGNFGNGGSSYTFYGEWYALAIYAAELTASDAQLMKSYVYRKFGILTGADTKLHMPGNSIVQGTKATLLMNNPRQAERSGFKRRIYINDMGIFGQTANTQNAHAASYTAAYDATLAHNLMYCPEGTNDIDGLASGSIVGGGTTIWNNYVSPFITAAKTAGFTCLVPTTIPRAWTGTSTDKSQKEAERMTLNGLVTSNAAGTGYTVVDYTTLTGFSNATDYSNTTYYASDQVHPTSTGYAVMSGLLVTQVNGLI